MSSSSSKVAKILFDREQIQKRVHELGTAISRDYHHLIQEKNELIVVGVLKGAFIFCADLVRSIDIPLKVDFVKASSYGHDTSSSGEVKLVLDTRLEVEGKDVLIVEDIVDTGLTMNFLFDHLRKKGARSIKLASFLYKPSRMKHEVEIDYLGFEIQDNFVVGYGLDYADDYRQLPYVGILEQ